MEAIYIIAPVESSVDAVISDFIKSPKYAAAHLFLITGLPQNLLKKIGQSPLKSHLKQLTEVYLEFLRTSSFYGQRVSVDLIC